MEKNSDFRIGLGYDIHRLADKRRLILGGVEIPYQQGLIGHSDADVMLHAICDAMLGAAALGDIGEYFPSTDIQYKDISSLELLKTTNDIISNKNFSIINIDVTLIMEEPKISHYKLMMREHISSVLKIEKESVNIKATTSEGVGPVGRLEAIACYAVVLLKIKN